MNGIVTVHIYNQRVKKAKLSMTHFDFVKRPGDVGGAKVFEIGKNNLRKNYSFQGIILYIL